MTTIDPPTESVPDTLTARLREADVAAAPTHETGEPWVAALCRAVGPPAVTFPSGTAN